MHFTYVCIDILLVPALRYAKQNRITLRQVVQGSRQHAELLRMVEVPVIETDEGTRGGPFEGRYFLPKASTDEELPVSQLLACWTLDSRLSEPGGDSMSAEHQRFIQRLFYLLEECGVPKGSSDRDLLVQLHHMIQEHCEDWGVELE
jgi:hypothetical protein